MSAMQEFFNLIKSYQSRPQCKELNKCSIFLRRNIGLKFKQSDLSSFTNNNVLEEELCKELNGLLEEVKSKCHDIVIDSFQIHNNRIYLKLFRMSVIKYILSEVSHRQSTYGGTDTFESRGFKISCTDCRDELTQLRMAIAARAVAGLIKLGRGQLSEDDDSEVICITHMANNDNVILVSSAKVPNSPNITKADFIRLRTEDMLAMGEHKELCEQSVGQLVNAAIVFDMLSVKLEKPLLLDLSAEPRSTRISNSKGGLFVVYNYARMCAILEKFDRCVTKGMFPPLPSLQEVDFSLLTEEDEWSLVYDLLSEWPTVVSDCQDLRQPRLHKVTCLMSSLATTFSVYYRHTRVLNDGQPHMVPLMVARIHLLLAIKQVFEVCFALLGVSVPTSM